MTNAKSTRELPQSGGSFKRHAGGLKQVDGSTKEAPPYHLRDAAARPTPKKTPAARPSTKKPAAKRAPATKTAKAAKSTAAKRSGAAPAAGAQNTGTGSDNAGGAAK